MEIVPTLYLTRLHSVCLPYGVTTGHYYCLRQKVASKSALSIWSNPRGRPTEASVNRPIGCADKLTHLEQYMLVYWQIEVWFAVQPIFFSILWWRKEWKRLLVECVYRELECEMRHVVWWLVSTSILLIESKYLGIMLFYGSLITGLCKCISCAGIEVISQHSIESLHSCS